jgi:hypothetical protein
VEAMLDGMSPEEFNEWVAYRRLEPDPLIRILCVLKAGLAAIANHASFDPEDSDPAPDE